MKKFTSTTSSSTRSHHRESFKGCNDSISKTSFIEHHSFVSCVEPKNVEEALQELDWINAMHEELNNFTHNEVWTLEERPQGARVIGTKWMFHNKQDDQGVVVRNKARLVAKGFSQVEGLDFGEAFAWL